MVGSHYLARTPTSTSLRWSRKRLGVQRWQDGLIWGDAVPLWFSACHARQPSVSRHAGVLFCAFPSLFCRPSSILRPIQSLTSDRWRSSRPVDRRALVLRASCRRSCGKLEQTERFKCRTLPSSQGRSSQLWINGLRPEQNGFRLLNAFVKRIGETDSPACGFRINLYQLAGNCCSQIPLLAPCRGLTRAPGTAVLVLGRNLVKNERRSIGHSQLDSRSKQGHDFANEFSRCWRFLEEDKKRLCATQTTNRKAPTVTANTSY